MELFIQFGYGMMQHCRALFDEWNGGTAILSPRDLEPEQLERLSRDLRERNGNVLLDPQFYLPRADYPRLVSHQYWPDDFETTAFNRGGRYEMMESLAELNDNLETSHFIIPGRQADEVDDLWLEFQRRLIEAAQDIVADRPLIATICLSSAATRSSEQISRIMEQAEEMSLSGYYLVLEHPDSEYLVSDPVWVANTLDFAAGLKRLGAGVIVGYSNHQQLIMASVAADAIASGNWLNVRAFPPDKFHNSYGEQMRRRATWYYCPQALSEYNLSYLDIGWLLGLQDELQPNPPTDHVEQLFSGLEPSASGWGETEAFRHYLSALHQQTEQATCDSFEATVDQHRTQLDEAEELITKFRDNGVVGRSRSAIDALEANRSALIVLERTQGPLLRRDWDDLIA